jgi:uncharacterized protein YbjQ (UPF0145 family)
MLLPLQRRGRRAIKKMMPKATKVGADGVVNQSETSVSVECLEKRQINDR